MPVSRDLADALIEVVRERMTEQQLSGRGLAERVGMSTTTLARHLRGATDLTVDQLDALAVAVGASGLEELMPEARRKM